MKKLLQNNKWIRYFIFAGISLSLFIGLNEISSAEGANESPKFVLIRLEDIGPGGQYATLEGLGKLRTVLEFLHQQHVQYSLAVIPRWINILPDGTVYDRTLDQTNEAYILSFNKLLHQAIQDGAALGMHGYTHQAGNMRRADGQHESGIGNEFNVSGLNETTTNLFAQERVKQGLSIFRNAGFVPEFWEAPHYHLNEQQGQVFRAYFGLLYEPNAAIPNASAAQYANEINSGYGAPTFGAVNVPTPLSYIPYNKNEKIILNQIGKTDRINSFFFHPFLEFKYLSPVVDRNGEIVVRDGLPEYKYPVENKSMLQNLIANFKSKEYQFYSVHDYVPFSPAYRVNLGDGNHTNIQIGDVTGTEQPDIVAWDKKTENVTVIEGQFKGMRNETQPAPKVWTTIQYQDGATFTLNDTNGDRKKGLWVVHPNGTLESYSSDGTRFVLNHTWNIAANRWLDLFELHLQNGDRLLAGQSQDHSQLLSVYLHNGTATSIEPYKFKSNSEKELLVKDLKEQGIQSLFISKKDTSRGVQFYFDPKTMNWKTRTVLSNIPAEPGRIHFGDFNGDGKEDILRWDEKNLKYSVYLQTAQNEYKLLSVFGPWGITNGRLIVADFDGNGKHDLALLTSHYMDTALSYQSKID